MWFYLENLIRIGGKMILSEILLLNILNKLHCFHGLQPDILFEETSTFGPILIADRDIVDNQICEIGMCHHLILFYL